MWRAGWGVVMKESVIEGYLLDQVEAAGGLALKFGVQHWPDRLVILPRWGVDGVLLRPAFGFAELKAPGKAPRAAQAARLKTLQGVGCMAESCASLGAVQAFLEELRYGPF